MSSRHEHKTKPSSRFATHPSNNYKTGNLKWQCDHCVDKKQCWIFFSCNINSSAHSCGVCDHRREKSFRVRSDLCSIELKDSVDFALFRVIYTSTILCRNNWKCEVNHVEKSLRLSTLGRRPMWLNFFRLNFSAFACFSCAIVPHHWPISTLISYFLFCSKRWALEVFRQVQRRKDSTSESFHRWR